MSGDLVRSLIPIFFGGVPIGILLLVLHLRVARWQASFKIPLTRSLLRPPGETLRLRILLVWERFFDTLLHLFGWCVLLGFCAWSAMGASTGSALTVILVIAVFPVAMIVWDFQQLMKLLVEYRNCSLGYLGERAIGEELNPLLAEGWQVFHDVTLDENPSQKPFNIDHVVVGIGGIFVIETKTRRKLKNTEDDEQNSVIYDGKTLRFPWGPEDGALRQVRANAESLRKWLKDYLKTPFPVRPVVALPGWQVDYQGKGDVLVASGRAIRGQFQNLRPIVSPESATAVSALLEKTCRDVSS